MVMLAACMCAASSGAEPLSEPMYRKNGLGLNLRPGNAYARTILQPCCTTTQCQHKPIPGYGTKTKPYHNLRLWRGKRWGGLIGFPQLLKPHSGGLTLRFPKHTVPKSWNFQDPDMILNAWRLSKKQT